MHQGNVGPSEDRVSCVVGLLRLWLGIFLVSLSAFAVKANAEILEECRELTSVENEIHNCLDNFLDVMDDNMADLEAYIAEEIGSEGEGQGIALAAFQSAQDAFVTYRRENCLWYQAFSQPKPEADQIAKACLATMTRQRLDELNVLLLDPQSSSPEVSGYYVYGTNRNSFQPCGSLERYWIEGDNVLVGQLQQDYLAKTEAELQILYIDVIGGVDVEAGSPYADHDGVFRIEQIRVVRTPVDNDCTLPAKKSAENTATSESERALDDLPDAKTAVSEEVQSTSDPEPTPEQELTAYFGDWKAQCRQLGSSYGCVLSVSMDDPAVALGVQVPATLKITRRSEQRTVVDVEIPQGEAGLTIDDVDQIQWQVDQVSLGAVLHAGLSEVSGSGDYAGTQFTRQSLRERWFIRDELLPLMLKGAQLNLRVSAGNGADATLTATLKGLGRALAFADDFTLSEE